MPVLQLDVRVIKVRRSIEIAAGSFLVVYPDGRICVLTQDQVISMFGEAPTLSDYPTPVPTRKVRKDKGTKRSPIVGEIGEPTLPLSTIRDQAAD